MLEIKLIALVFVIQWLVFIPAYAFKTERYYDLTGSLTYTSVMVIALLAVDSLTLRTVLLAALVIIWSLRLGLFLFSRISAAGGDSRFEQIKIAPLRFFKVWTLQAVWVTFTAAAALLAMTSNQQAPFGAITALGVLLWVLGFAIEVIADQQKSRFRSNPDNANAFISTGLWSFCRHPNYFGEIWLWVGIALIALPVLEGWRVVGLLSPVFVALLLIRGSGIPLLERAAEEKWGSTEAYQQYKASTPRLFPGY